MQRERVLRYWLAACTLRQLQNFCGPWVWAENLCPTHALSSMHVTGVSACLLQGLSGGLRCGYDAPGLALLCTATQVGNYTLVILPAAL